jgi:hypothetical protein
MCVKRLILSVNKDIVPPLNEVGEVNGQHNYVEQVPPDESVETSDYRVVCRDVQAQNASESCT